MSAAPVNLQPPPGKTTVDLGRKYKDKNPGLYDDLSDVVVGRRLVEKYPEYSDFVDVPDDKKTPPPPSKGFSEALAESSPFLIPDKLDLSKPNGKTGIPVLDQSRIDQLKEFGEGIGQTLWPGMWTPEHSRALQLLHGVPLIGPTLSQIGSDIGNMDFPELAGHLLGALSTPTGVGSRVPIAEGIPKLQSPVGLREPFLPDLGPLSKFIPPYNTLRNLSRIRLQSPGYMEPPPLPQEPLRGSPLSGTLPPPPVNPYASRFPERPTTGPLPETQVNQPSLFRSRVDEVLKAVESGVPLKEAIKKATETSAPPVTELPAPPSYPEGAHIIPEAERTIIRAVAPKESYVKAAQTLKGNHAARYLKMQGKTLQDLENMTEDEWNQTADAIPISRLSPASQKAAIEAYKKLYGK